MDCEFSELSFAFSFLNSFKIVYGLQTLPNFITQAEENRQGYDASIDKEGTIYFFQFKVPKLLVKSNARIYSNDIGLPYFRFKLLRTPWLASCYNQHNKLVELSKSHDSVYYCSPEFSKLFDLQNYNNHVVNHSALFKPADIGIINDSEKEHLIVYNENSSTGYFCSENKRKMDKFKPENLLKYAKIRLDNTYFYNLLKNTISIAIKDIDDSLKYGENKAAYIERIAPIKIKSKEISKHTSKLNQEELLVSRKTHQEILDSIPNMSPRQILMNVDNLLKSDFGLIASFIV